MLNLHVGASTAGFAAAPPDMTMKLLIDTKGRRVLYAEAGKDVVDFLFRILSRTIKSVTELLTSNEMVGSIGNMYRSIEDLSDRYLMPKKGRDTLLNSPFGNPSPADSTDFFSGIPRSLSTKTIYRCGNANSYTCGRSCDPYVTFNSNQICPNCKRSMTSKATIVGEVNEWAPSSEGVCVQGLVTYMIMDDLVVKPLSTISSIALFNKFNVDGLGSLAEKEVNLTEDEGKKLLKASLQSKTVLTDVFFEDKMPLKQEKISMESVE